MGSGSGQRSPLELIGAGKFDRKPAQEQRRQTAYSRSMTNTERWNAVQQRRREAGFFYAVKTTGVYCRPSCPSRRPDPQNVLYFDQPADAEQAGFRACRRCDPRRSEPRVGLVTDLCRYIEANANRRISLAELSAFADLSPFHLQRTFREEVGVSPREYQAALNNRQADPGDTITYDIVDSPLGRMLVAASGKGLCAVSFGSTDAELEQWIGQQLPFAKACRGVLSDVARQVIETIETGSCELALDIRGTAFQQKVWKALRAIPRGETRSYEDLAQAAGQPRAVRAVARACAANRIAIVVPCHRIVRKDGSLGGYRWGVDRKKTVLELERPD